MFRIRIYEMKKGTMENSPNIFILFYFSRFYTFFYKDDCWILVVCANVHLYIKLIEKNRKKNLFFFSFICLVLDCISFHFISIRPQIGFYVFHSFFFFVFAFSLRFQMLLCFFFVFFRFFFLCSKPLNKG